MEIRQYLADSLKNFTKIGSNSNNNIGPKFIWANGDHEDDDDLEDIFTMSSNESSPAPEEILTDTDSLYCDALSRKASIVRFVWMCEFLSECDSFDEILYYFTPTARKRIVPRNMLNFRCQLWTDEKFQICQKMIVRLNTLMISLTF